MWKISNLKSNLFFSKKFQPTNAAEKALCTKRHFSNGNHSKKKISKIPKISKILLSCFSKKKIEKKILKKIPSAPAAPRRHFIFRRLRRLLLFSIGKWFSLGKGEKKNWKKNRKKYLFFLSRRLRRLSIFFFFFGACGALFFFNRKMKILRKNKKKSKKNQVARLRGAYLKIPSLLKSDATLRGHKGCF